MQSQIKRFVALMLGAACGLATAQIDLPAPIHPVGQGPSDLLLADLNGDGAPDMVTANRDSSDLSVLLSDGASGFGAEARVAISGDARAVAAGDLDNDGDVDLVVITFGSEPATAHVRLGNGDGTFTSGPSFGIGSNATQALIADMNGDGMADLIVGGGAASVWLGLGDGTFNSPPLTPGLTVGKGAITDLNEDGIPDFVAPVAANDEIAVLLGAGDGSLSLAGLHAAGDKPVAVAAGDLNGDGHIDVVSANEQGDSVSVLLGGGDGTLGTHLELPAGDAPIDLILVDIDGDATLDVVALDSYFQLLTPDGLSVLIGQGDGTFGPAEFLAGGVSPSALAAGDLNGDGRSDLAFASLESDWIVTYLGQAGGTVHAPSYFATAENHLELIAADLNNDGDIDLAAITTLNKQIQVYLGNGSGDFTVVGTGFRAVNSPVDLKAADLDDDGVLDLVAANESDGSVSVLRGRGDGTYFLQHAYGVGARPHGVAVGDVNGDGVADLVTANSTTDDLSVLIGNGDATFAAEYRIQDASDDPEHVALADLNADGKIDLLSSNRSSNNIAYRLGNGDGTFGSPSQRTVNTRPDEIAIADLDGDGDLDVVVSQSGSATRSVAVLLGDGSGVLAPATMYPTGLWTKSLTLADIDADGAVDIVTADGSGYESSLSVLRGVGDGSFAPFVSFLAGDSTDDVAAADFDGDGTIDLAATNNNDLQSITFHFQRALDGGPCSTADFAEPYGVLDFFDVLEFLGAFTAHENRADLADDGVFDFFDVAAFLGVFSAGCP